MVRIRKVYQAVIGGIWFGVVIATIVGRYITIPPMSWLLTIKICAMMGLVSTPVLLFLAWMTEKANQDRVVERVKNRLLGRKIHRA